MFNRILSILQAPDPDLVMAYQYKLPESINVRITPSANGYIASVDKINNKPLNETTFIIEAETGTELVNEINDMLLAYLDFPQNIRQSMPKLLPPEHALNALDKNTQANKALVFAK